MISAERKPTREKTSRLIESRAFRMGVRGAALDDAVTDVMPHALSFQYDASRSNGASRKTALIAVIDRQLLANRRREQRYQNCLKRAREEIGRHDETTYEDQTELPLDMAEGLNSLNDEERRVCELLSQGSSISEVATYLGCDWHTVQHRVARIRTKFTALGLNEWTKQHD